MRRPDRVELYKEICRKASMVPRSVVGYFSRKEMMELLLCLNDRDKAEQLFTDGKGNKSCQPKEKTV